MNKIELIEDELKKLNIAFKEIEKDVKKYKILEDERNVKKNIELLRYCEDKIMDYTKKIYDTKIAKYEVQVC